MLCRKIHNYSKQQTNKFIFSNFAPRPVGLLSILKVNMKPTLFTPLNARSEMTFQLTPHIPFCSAPSFQPPFWHITPFTIQSIPRKIKSWLHFLTEKVLLRNRDYRRKIGCEWFVILTWKWNKMKSSKTDCVVNVIKLKCILFPHTITSVIWAI